MPKAIGSHIYQLSNNRDGLNAAWQRTNAKDMLLDEAWLQKLIFETPDLVVDACRQADATYPDENWFPWAREVRVGDSGYVDVLLVSSRGRLGIIETKLAHNSQARREVVAQLLDYVLTLCNMSMDQLDLPPLPTGISPTDVAHNLRTGDFLLVVAGDAIDERALRLLQGLLGKHLANPWDLVMTRSTDKVPYMALDPGTRLGADEVLSLLGAGVMGEVYRATDAVLKREVALQLRGR